jgi:hypothetical protein
MKGRINKQINIGCIYNVVCAPLVGLLSWQRATHLADVMPHCGISPDMGVCQCFINFKFCVGLCDLWEICVSNVVIHLADQEM